MTASRNVPDALVRRNSLRGAVYSYEDLLKSDVSAVAIFTQRWRHGPMAIEALKHGKHVYSTVPMAIAKDEIEEILQLVTQTGLIYMMGETSHYNPAAVYGRRRLAAAGFGRQSTPGRQLATRCRT